MKTTELYRKSLRFLIEKGEATQTGLATAIGVQPQSMNDFLQGRRNFSEDQKEQIAKVLATTYIDMLIMGRSLIEGKEQQPSPPPPERPLILDVVNGFEKINLEDNLEHYRDVPLYKSGKISTKISGYTFDETEIPDSTVIVYQPVLRNRVKHDLRALRMNGDSMWSLIPKGSIVAVDGHHAQSIIKRKGQKFNKSIALVKKIRNINQSGEIDWHKLVVGSAVGLVYN